MLVNQAHRRQTQNILSMPNRKCEQIFSEMFQNIKYCFEAKHKQSINKSTFCTVVRWSDTTHKHQIKTHTKNPLDVCKMLPLFIMISCMDVLKC